MSQYYSNVFFVGVARMEGQAMVIASHSYNTDTDLSLVRQVLEQPNMALKPGNHYTFPSNQMEWHLIGDDDGLIYLLICRIDYPSRVAHACLEETQRSFIGKVGADKARVAKERGLDKTCSAMLQKICAKYDNLPEVDKLSAVAQKVNNVKLVMQENVDMALKNCVKLESIEKAAEDLQQQAGVFKRNANDLKKKMWWKNLKMKLVIGFIILAIIGVIIGVAVAMSKN